MQSILWKSCVIACAAAFASACGVATEPPPPGTGTNRVSCEALTVVVGSAPKLVFVSMPEGAYGANNFMLWKVQGSTDAAGATAYTFADGSAVLHTIPNRNWTFPAPLWSAGRFAGDGHDPLTFTSESPYVAGYLPATPSIPWTSSSGAKNDGTCPANNVEIGGRMRCIDTAQLDPASPAPSAFASGHTYLARFVMGGTINGSLSFASHCYEAIFTFP